MSNNLTNLPKDHFGGITLSSEAISETMTSVELGINLPNFILAWQKEAVRVVWLKIEIGHSDLIPICVKNGFKFHHAKSDFVMMVLWLADEHCNLPAYPFTTIGVGGLVVNDKEEVLLMRQLRGHYHGWQYPGGLADPGEHLFETAEREVLEETGVSCKSERVLCFRHQHEFKWEGCSDIYFCCLMRPIDSTSIHKCPQEAFDCKWFSREELKKLPNEMFRDFHWWILTQYDNFMASGKAIDKSELQDKKYKRTLTLYSSL